MSVAAQREFEAGRMQAAVYADQQAMAQAAAAHTAGILSAAVAARGDARVVIATGNSQLGFTQALRDHDEIGWDRITVFHMDEYIGIAADHPASFRRWLRERVVDVFHPATMHYLDGESDDLEGECRRYETLLREAPIDLICMGIGENGHIAFNDPPVADFDDPVWVKVAQLDDACRRQQVGEGHFPTVDDVPPRALTLTIPALLAPRVLQVVVPEERKAEAVRRTVGDPVSTACPATVLRQQAHARLFMDAAAASRLDAG